MMMRVVAVVASVGLLSGCLMTRKERKVAVYGTVAVALIGIGVSLHGIVSTCEARPVTGSQDCEEDRHDRKLTGGAIALGGLAAAIIAQLWPVSDPESTVEQPTVRVVEAPPPPPASATALHGETAMKLARNAQVLAASGKCVEAYGSLKALRTLDAPLADQLMAWDPTVSRCRTVMSATAIEATITPATPAPPSTVAPTTP